MYTRSTHHINEVNEIRPPNKFCYYIIPYLQDAAWCIESGIRSYHIYKRYINVFWHSESYKYGFGRPMKLST